MIKVNYKGVDSMGKILYVLGVLCSLSFLGFFTYELIATSEIHIGAVVGMIVGLSLMVAHIHLFQFNNTRKKEDSIY